MVKIDDVIDKVFDAEGGLHPGSKAMRGILPETLQRYFDANGIPKKVPIGSPGLGEYMKREVTPQVARKIYEEKYFKPNGLDTLTHPKVASILMGILIHLPSLTTSVIGDALTRLGTTKKYWKGNNPKDRVRQIKINQEWLAELDTYSRKVGAAPVYNAVHDSIWALYKERRNLGEIDVRLKRVWLRMSDCAEGTPIIADSHSGSGFWEGDGTIIIDNNQGMCDPYTPQVLTFQESTEAKLKGWWQNLSSIRYAVQEPAVLPGFLKALAVILLFAGIGVGAYILVKKASR